MRYFLFLVLHLFVFFTLQSQDRYEVSGSIFNNQKKVPLPNVAIVIEENQIFTQTNADGFFNLVVPSKGNYILNISSSDFLTLRMPITIENKPLLLGAIYLDRDITSEKTDNLITLTDSELFDDEINSNSSGLLQATRDIFLSRAAFDFGQAFFRVRGYDSQNGRVLVNGITMNKLFDGRPQWNNWGGLNDVTRNQQFTNGLNASDFTFGGVLGTTNIDTRPSKLRSGTRLSSSASNRTYGGRLMATYNSGVQKNGLTYSFSGSRRWSKQGYIEGTLYDAFSFFGVMEYQFNEKNSIIVTAIAASNRRGRSSAITEEVFELVGKQYNPYWGQQNSKIRNSRERKIAEPILMFNHYYASAKFSLNIGVSYQFGTNTRSRLGYYNAPNPDPTYYRYLPSFYINSPIGANFLSANLAKEGFIENSQLDWNATYSANEREQAAYVLYDDIRDDKELNINTTGNIDFNDHLKFDFGLSYKNLFSDNYAKIEDLLGSVFHEDIDPFSETLNDVNGEVQKIEDDIFNYHYKMEASQLNTFAQLQLSYDKWNAFISGNYSTTDYKRKGLFQNERFLENSLGESDVIQFSNYGLKAGFTYKISGRHWVTAHGAFLTQPPILQNVFINPRENNNSVSNIQSETILTNDINYFIRLPKLTGRVTGFYTRFQNTTDINFFFVDAGVGSDFVQEVITDLDKLHMGAEIGFEYELSSSVKLSAVASLGKYSYASNPNVSINFDTAGAEEDLINPDGNIDLGVANIKDYKLAQGPQQAYAIGINYRAPKYWWVGVTTNYLTNNYANISTITRTQSFFVDPETGQQFPDATSENVDKLLAQKPLDNFYLLNLVGGKSWLKKGKYISIFASINNVFDAEFRTGGYEQSRNGNFGQLQQDNLSGTPSFAPKYWYGFGRTYFLNVAYSF